MPTMHVALLGNGHSAHIRTFASSLSKSGIRTTLITSDRYKIDIPGVAVSYFNSKLLFPFRMLSIRGIIEHIKPDILHSHFLTYGGYLGYLSGFHPHIISLWGDDVWLEPSKSLIHKIMAPIAMQNADFILPVASHLKRRCQEMNIPSEKITVFQWGVELDQFFVSPVARETIRKSLNLSTESILLFSPRLLQPYYNHHLLLEAVSLLASAIKQRIKIVFKDYDSAPSYRMQINQLATLHGLQDQIIWLEQLSISKLNEFYNAADLMISLPPNDGAPMSVQESLACGCPVLSANSAGAIDFIEHGVNGFLTQLSPNEIAKHLKEYALLNETQMKTLRSSSRATAERKSDRVKLFNDLVPIYKKILRNHKHS